MSASARSLAERHSCILDRLRKQGYVTVADLSEGLDVSEVTIRKDLRALEGRDLLFRTHGGANLVDPFVQDRPVAEKARVRAREKRRIGRAAAALVEPGDTILLASGTTVRHVVPHLEGARNLTAMTSAMNVALELAQLDGIEILMLGGLVRRSSTSVVGPYAEEMLQGHAFTKLFLGVDGFDPEHGFTTSNALEAALNQQMMAAAQKTIVVADATKFGRRGFRRICRAEDVDRVITDDEAGQDVLRHFEAHSVEVQSV